jgi:hypothetical protein
MKSFKDFITEEKLKIPTYKQIKGDELPFYADEAKEMGYDASSPENYHKSVVRDLKSKINKDGFIRLNRTLKISKGRQVNTKNLGTHWSPDVINTGNHTHTVSADVHHSDIDWHATMQNRFNNPYENEVTLKPESKPQNLSIEKVKKKNK